MKRELTAHIKKILEDMGIESPIVFLDIPTQSKLGDYSSNVAMMYAKQLGKKPIDLAHEIAEAVRGIDLAHISRVDVVAPGFINFFFDVHFFKNSLEDVLAKKETCGMNETRSKQKTIVEYTDPNPFKEFHIGHLMSNTIGEAISRLVGAQGAEVVRACYQGDVGIHVATAVWGIKELKFDMERITPEELGKAYAYGSMKLKDDELVKNKIAQINKKIFSREDVLINEVYDAGRQISLDYFETIYKKLGTQFDYYFFESNTGPFGKETVLKNLGSIFEKSDGAIIFKGEEHDTTLHTRVFINKDGLPTYEAKELGLSKIKYDTYPYDLSIVVTGNEINEYFRVLLKAMTLVFPELAVKTKHLSHGMLRLPEGKMSSRTGQVITAISLIEGIQKRIVEKMSEREMSEEVKKHIAEIVAIGALKYSILKQTVGKDIIFDLEKSISFEGDSGPYLQYATVRAQSILKKVGGVTPDSSLPSGWETTDLERLIERYSYIVERAGREYAPQHIVTYLIELAGEFNSFYASHKIIDSTDPTSPYKLALTQAFVYVMNSGLNLLGIQVPDEM